ncbi:hypothetical protein SEA_SONALI_54 [Arthrobacter phage Sonali]|uniref:Uncharacterized protein n=1 Tax=Arthrobacter phage Sonali TaxID=2510495 RepID=A0A411CQT5_9CAUD|nr:hypothetical protein HOV09_gp54 [Arthrobacter phage Sonali]QAY16166.1 hypothetical protein SEA_SONALI_54 [Arthrobacter phage Sonali]
MSRDVRATVTGTMPAPSGMVIVELIVDAAELGDVRIYDHLTLNIKEARRAP